MNERIRKLLLERGIGELTNVQEKLFPVISSGKNVLAIAPTGFGKTEAAPLPIFQQIAEKRTEPVSLICITPLRALNSDLFGSNEVNKVEQDAVQANENITAAERDLFKDLLEEQKRFIRTRRYWSLD